MIKTRTGRPVGRPREFDESRVLEAAMNAFWRKGYEATSLVDLTTVTGLNKASLYRVFGDKHRLFLAALQNYADVEFRETTAVISPVATPLENIRAVVQRICDDAGSEKGCMMINSMVELAPHDPEVKDLLRRFGEQRLDALRDMLARAQAAGEIRADLDPERLARSLMIALAGSAAMVKGFMPGEAIVENLDTLIDSWTCHEPRAAHLYPRAALRHPGGSLRGPAGISAFPNPRRVAERRSRGYDRGNSGSHGAGYWIDTEDRGHDRSAGGNPDDVTWHLTARPCAIDRPVPVIFGLILNQMVAY